MNNEFIELTYFRGRVGLYHILKTLGIGSNDLIALQAYTCLAVPESILATGAKPIFIDIEENGVNMCIFDLEKKFNKNIKAVVVQHTFGIPANINDIVNFCNKHNIFIIEDCCHTINSTYLNKKVGTFGIASFYSWEWGKPVVAGIGGSIVINDDSLNKNIVETYSNFKEPNFTQLIKLQIQYIIYNIFYSPRRYWLIRRLFRFFSKLGLAKGNFNAINIISEDFSLRMAKPLIGRLKRKLTDLKNITNHSLTISKIYESISNVNVKKIVYNEEAATIFARYPIRVKDKTQFIEKAMLSSIEIADWYLSVVHPLKEDELKLINYTIGDCPNAERACSEIISLPVNLKTSISEANRIKKFVEDN